MIDYIREEVDARGPQFDLIIDTGGRRPCRCSAEPSPRTAPWRSSAAKEAAPGRGRAATTAGVAVLKIPSRAPKANAHAERWVRTARAECLDWILVRSQRHLHRVLTAYVEHYNTGRPHRGNHLDVPVRPAGPPTGRRGPLGQIERVDVLGGLIHEYRHAA